MNTRGIGVGAFAARPSFKAREICLALLGVSFAGASLHAQSSRVTFEVSADAGASWQRSISLNGGTADILVRMKLRLDGATALGLAGVTHQPTLSNWRTAFGDSVAPFTFPGLANVTGNPTTETAYQGRHVSATPATNTGRIFPFGASGMNPGSANGLLTAWNDAGNQLRFAGSRAANPSANAAFGLATAQLPPEIAVSTFNSSLNAEVFRYGVRIDASNQQYRLMEATTQYLSTNWAVWYLTADGLSTSNIPISGVDIATIEVNVPSPGSAGLLGIGLMVVGGRRRRCA